jgi:hypothetical protein
MDISVCYFGAQMTWDATTNVRFWVDANLDKVFILQHEHHLGLYFLSKFKHHYKENSWWNWTIKGWDK